jgi:putative YhdH/YhfP family quinone oxidoreductase
MKGIKRMESNAFKALVVTEKNDGSYARNVENRTISDLPEGDLLIRVHYSSLNYKDALSASGNRGVTKHYPHVPGIDAAGIVEKSSAADFKKGDQVIVSGYDLGMNTSGGYGQYINVPSSWVLHCPSELTLREAMIYGTAGFTAAQSVLRLVEFPVLPDQGKILVSGATGGVGSVAIALLANLGYDVTAVSGKPEAAEFLHAIGAENIITREQANDQTGKLLLKEKWAGVVDTVGGEILTTAIRSTAYGGAITCCGNVASPDLPLSVYPFILRGVSLLGIDSAKCPMATRLQVWQKLSTDWKLPNLESFANEYTLSDLATQIELMLQSRQTGRVIVNMQ